MTVDPVVCAAKIVVELQTIVSREVNPFAPTVVSVGSIHGGEAMNVIPEDVRLTGTFRSLTSEGLAHVSELRDDAAARAIDRGDCHQRCHGQPL